MLAGLAILFLSSACAPRPLSLPLPSAGVPSAAFGDAFRAATGPCAGIQSLTAELRLSGRAGRQRLQGRALLGVASPDRLRLEALAPFGPPVFILVAHGDHATLLLPRDDRVVLDEPPAAILEALAGVEVDPATLRAALAGCGLADVAARSARVADDEWLIVDVGENRTLYLRRSGDAGWRVRGARTPAFTLTYDELGPRLPARLTIVARRNGEVFAEVRLEVTDPHVNAPLGDEAFEVNVPDSAVPLTIDELRDAGPLGEGPKPAGRAAGPRTAPAARAASLL